MSLTLPIIVYGNGAIFSETFNAIAASMHGSDYHYLLKMAIMLSGVWAIVNFSAGRDLSVLVKWVFAYILAFSVVFHDCTVEIIDRLNQDKGYSVDHVPLGLALMANLTSAIGDGLTQLLEKNFTLPEDARYSKTGMIMESRLVLASTQFQVTDPRFGQSLNSFVNQCIFYDLLLHKYTWNDLLTSSDIWAFVQQEASPARAFSMTDSKTGQRHIMTCQQGSALLAGQWNNAINDAATHYGNLLYPNSSNANAQLLAYLPNSYDFLNNIAQSAASLMRQNLMANAIQNGLVNWGTKTNSTAALEAYAFVKAQQQKRIMNATLAQMAAYWLPLMKNIFEALIFASFIFIFPIILFPFGKAVLKNYVVSLIWLQLWAPLYAILNMFMMFYAQQANAGISSINGHPALVLSNQAGIAQVNSDLANLAGYMTILVPFLSYGVMKGMMSAFLQASQYLGGAMQSAASSTASEVSSGNISLGNTNYDNNSASNTSANHFDTNARVLSGAYTYQLPGSSTLTVASDGSTIMNNQPAISSLGTSVNVAHAIREMAGQQADSAYSAALNSAHAYSNSVSSGFRQLMELGDQVSHSQSSGEASSMTQSGGLSSSLSNIHQLTERFSHDQNISYADATKVLASAYASARISESAGGVGADAGIRAEMDHSLSHEQRSLASSAQDYVHNTNFAHSVDTAVRATQEHSFRTGDENSQRLANSVSNSFDHSAQTRNEMGSQYQQSQNFKDMASYAEENSTSINSNANQVFMNWLKDQPSPGSTGKSMGMRSAEYMMTNEPELAQGYAERFSAGEAQHYLKSFKESAGSSEQSIQQDNDQHNAQIDSKTDVSQRYKAGNIAVKESAVKEELNQGQKIDDAAKRDAKNMMRDTAFVTATGKKGIDDNRDRLKDKIEK